MVQTLSQPQKKLALCLLLFLVTVAVFSQVRHHEFINLDDEQYVTQNPRVRAGLTSDSLAWAFTSTYASNWHPLTWVSHMLDVQLFGMNPAGHHSVNLFFHLANAILLFLVLHRMTHALWQSVAVAFLFALHPLHVESVAWVAERKDVLSTFLMLCTLWFYISYSRNPTPSRGIPVLLFYALGLMAKPMLVTLPFVLLLLDYWPLGRLAPANRTLADPIPAADVLPEGNKKKRKRKREGTTPAVPVHGPEGNGDRVLWRLITEKLPLFVLAVLSSLVTFAAQQGSGAMSPLDAVPMLSRLGNGLIAYASYITKTLYPQGLAVFYPYPPEIAAWKVLGSAAWIAALTVLAIRFRRQCPYAIVGWLWFLGTLVPVIGFVQVGMQAMADRYTYMPHIGLFIAAVWGLVDLAGRWPRGKETLAACFGIAVAVLAVLTWNQLAHWRNSITLFEHALRVTERNSLAHTNLGVALSRTGKGADAAAHYLEAIRINPNSSGSHFNVANYYVSTGQKENALHHYREAIRINPRYANAYNNLGMLMMSEHRAEDAIPYYRKAIELEPANAGTRFNCGLALAAAGQLPKAVEQFTRALELRPNYAEAHNYLGMTLQMQGKREEAIRHFQQALWIKPDFIQARRNLESLSGGLNAPDPSRSTRWR